jgi:Ca-activated chloride channel family protein
MDLRALSAFHFLHPAWLLALPVLLAWALWRRRSAGGDWTKVADPELLSLLRIGASRGSSSPWPLIGAAWTLAVLALAGPAWSRLQTPAFRAPPAWVLVLDLSPSMSASDTAPNRVTRARYAAADILDAARDARVGLVAFAGEPHVVAPLTTDVATVRVLLKPLSPALMPESGDSLAPALEAAEGLLAAGSARHGQVVVLSDGFADPAESLRAAQELRQKGITVQVIGVGTQAGAPEPNGKGGFVLDSNGRVRVTRERSDELRRLATAGGGHFVPAEAVATQLLPVLEARGSPETEAQESHAQLSTWRNEGIWLLPLVLLLAGLLARRGWI